MSNSRRHLLPARSSRAFTIVEAMVFAALLMSLTAVGYRSMFTFTEQQKLRVAAIELSAYLEVARNVALTDNTPCVIAMTNSNGGLFSPDKNATINSCTAGKLVTSLNLRELTGSKNLRVSLLPGSGSFPITFNPEGTTRNATTVVISSTDVTSGGWCVDVQAPLAIVRRGWRVTGANSCRYVVEQ
jgi:Tfp pilus assembly protein FimT